MIRLFVSVELSEKVRKEIGIFLKKLKRRHWPVRWVAVENIHITLAFLGWKSQKFQIPNSKFQIKTVNLIKECLEKVVEEMKPFGLKIRGIGCFPDFKRPRVVWLGLAGDLESLTRLQKQVVEELEKARVESVRWKLVPHLTLGRVKRGTRAGALHNLGDQIKRMKVGEFQSKILVEKASLMESKLRRKGPIYRELASVKLKISKA